jgi:membrane-associated protease RseP (regulator of RpoE activity)
VGQFDNIHGQMTAHPVSVGATPILDSAVRPKARKKKLAGVLLGVFVGICCSAVMINASNHARAERNPAREYILLLFFLVLALTVVVHESGHLLAGWMVGFRFNAIAIGPFSARMEYGRLKVQVRKALPAGGYAGMGVNQVRRLRRRLLAFIAGGPMANLLSAALIALFLAYDPLLTSWLSVAGDIFWKISAMIGVANFLPFRLGMLYTDGARIVMLFTSRSRSQRWMSLMAVGSQSHAGVRPKSWRRTWLDAAGRIRDESVDDFAGNWIAYAAANDRKDAPVAASHLERCLELVNLLGPSLQDLVALEAAVFTAWFRGNTVIAEKWLGQVKRIKTLPQLMQIRADIALHCARREFAPALSKWQQGFVFIEKLPPSPVKTRLTEGFLEWRDEIQERQNLQATSPADSTSAAQTAILS